MFCGFESVAVSSFVSTARDASFFNEEYGHFDWGINVAIKTGFTIPMKVGSSISHKFAVQIDVRTKCPTITAPLFFVTSWIIIYKPIEFRFNSVEGIVMLGTNKNVNDLLRSVLAICCCTSYLVFVGCIYLLHLILYVKTIARQVPHTCSKVKNIKRYFIQQRTRVKCWCKVCYNYCNFVRRNRSSTMSFDRFL